MNVSEISNCDICNQEKSVSREYYYYDVECDCCNSKESPHFEIVRYCMGCTPTPPKIITVHLQPSLTICN